VSERLERLRRPDLLRRLHAYRGLLDGVAVDGAERAVCSLPGGRHAVLILPGDASLAERRFVARWFAFYCRLTILDAVVREEEGAPLAVQADSVADDGGDA
jgi:hypothetical protein